MNNKWSLVKLRTVLEQNITTEQLEPAKVYRLLGVKLEGRGPFIREEKPGSEIRARELRRVTIGQFIYSRLFAWRGAFGLIPSEMDGAFVSNEFPTFRINTERLVPKFIELYFKQAWVWDKVETYCMGTTKASRNRFKEKYFLNLEIPLPAIEQQNHIISRIEIINELKTIHTEIAVEIQQLFSSILNSAFTADL